MGLLGDIKNTLKYRSVKKRLLDEQKRKHERKFADAEKLWFNAGYREERMKLAKERGQRRGRSVARGQDGGAKGSVVGWLGRRAEAASKNLGEFDFGGSDFLGVDSKKGGRVGFGGLAGLGAEKQKKPSRRKRQKTTIVVNGQTITIAKHRKRKGKKRR